MNREKEEIDSVNAGITCIFRWVFISHISSINPIPVIIGQTLSPEFFLFGQLLPIYLLIFTFPLIKEFGEKCKE